MLQALTLDQDLTEYDRQSKVMTSSINTSLEIVSLMCHDVDIKFVI